MRVVSTADASADATGHTDDLGRVSVPARPVRVMHVVYRLAGGGMEHNIVKLANAHDRSRVVPLICSCQPADHLKQRLDPSVPLFELARREGNDLRFARQLVGLIARERPDIVHTHAWGTLCEGFLAAKLAHIPVVHAEDGTLDLRPLNRRVQQVVWRGVDQVVSVSSRLAERMSGTIGFPLKRIKVVRNGVELERFAQGNRARARMNLGLGPDEPLIGTVGRLEPVKDHESLLASLAILKQLGIPFKAIIVGDGSLRKMLQDLAERQGLGDAVRLVGARTDVEDLLAAMDVFVLSSRSEALPNVIAEAMAAGLPVVATRVGGTDELVEEGVTGLLVPPVDPSQLAASIVRLLKNPAERRVMGSHGRERANRLFGLARMAREYEDLYLSLVRR